MVDLSKQKLSTFLFSIEQFIKNQTKKNPDVLNKCKSKDYTIQFTSFDESVTKYFIFKEGKLISRSGVHPFPDFTVTFKETVDYTSLLSSIISQTEIIDFLKSESVTCSGKEDYILGFFETLSLIFEASTEFGEKLNNTENIFITTSNKCPAKIQVKHQKIVRISPIKLNERDAQVWNVEALNKNLKPSVSINLNASALGYKQFIYAENRILSPLIRKDYDPHGNINPQNRGKSEFKRISWDEAFKIIAGLITKSLPSGKRNNVTVTISPEQTWGTIGSEHSCHKRFFQLIDNVKVINAPNDISWQLGAIPAWGHSETNGKPLGTGTLEDMLKNCQNVIFWTCNSINQNGNDTNQRWQWLKKSGKNILHIDSEYTGTASFLGGKWLPLNPGTSVALAFSIAYIWLSNSWVDNTFLKQHTLGFNAWKDFLNGKTDGTPKTPQWQEPITGIKARDVKVIANEWAHKPTYLFCGGNQNNDFRENNTYSGIDLVKTLIFLQALRGVGKQGTGFDTSNNAPLNDDFFFPGFEDGGICFKTQNNCFDLEWIGRLKEKSYYKSAINQIPYYQLFNENNKIIGNYSSEPSNLLEMSRLNNINSNGQIQVFYQVGNRFSASNGISKQMQGLYHSDKLQCVVNQSPWLEGDALYADIILPSCTMPERWDIIDNQNTGHSQEKLYKQANYRFIYLSQRAIQPLGESKPDYEIFYGLAKALGFGYAYSKGLSELEWCKKIHAASDLPKYISWERFAKKGFFVVPLKEKSPKGLYETPVYQSLNIENPDARFSTNFGLAAPKKLFDTQSGKINFNSQLLYNADNELVDDLVLSNEQLKQKLEETNHNGLNFRLLVIPHPFFEGNMPFENAGNLNKLSKFDKYNYPVVFVNQQNAGELSIESGNLLKISNMQSEIFAIAEVTEEIIPGTIKMFNYFKNTEKKVNRMLGIQKKEEITENQQKAKSIELLFEGQNTDIKVIRPSFPLTFVNLEKVEN